MKIEPVINSQISLLKKRNLGLAKLAEEYPHGKSCAADSWDNEIRENCFHIAEFVKLLKEARELDSNAIADEDNAEDAEAEVAVPAWGNLPQLPRVG